MSHRCKLHFTLSLVCCVCISASARQTAIAQDNDKPNIEIYLEEGRLADGEAAMAQAIAMNPEDQQARFSLGVVKFLRAVERLAQSHYEYGLLQHQMRQIPFVRLPVPSNPDPQEISYQDAREILDRFIKDLAKAERTLAAVETSDVKLPLHFGRIRLDLDGDGNAADEESLWQIFRLFNGAVQQVDGEAFQITFDGGDVHWLRGYCHLLMALGEMAFAYDWQDLFERTGHLFYPKVDTPFDYLQAEGTGDPGDFNYRNFVDVIALVHLINFPVEDAKRTQAALMHFESMIDQSRASWALIVAETDDNHEWLPNPQQTGVIPNVRIRREMIDEWHKFLVEMEAILQGEKLVPFWRGAPGGGGFRPPPINPEVGINLRRVFTEPTRFDLVMWIQGSAANPYLEKGEMTDPEVWQRLTRVFGGEFFGFAIWFN